MYIEVAPAGFDDTDARPGGILIVSPIAIVILSLSMSADAFAASIARGASTRPGLMGAVRGGLVFGTVETITPLIGWAIGRAASSFIGAIDHWVAFGLLAVVGGKMIWDAFQNDGDEVATQPRRGGIVTLVVTAVGTSIDAAAVGVSLALVGADIVPIALSIGFATFVMTTIGLTIGRAAGHRLGSAVEILGGLALIAIGSIILTQHLRGLA